MGDLPIILANIYTLGGSAMWVCATLASQSGVAVQFDPCPQVLAGLSHSPM